MESITALFKDGKEPRPATTPPPTRNTSEATETTIAGTGKDAGIEEKDLGISPVASEQSQNKKTDEWGSQSSTSSPKEGETSSTKKRDPFAGGVDGGVTYQVLTWWEAALGMVAETISLGILGLPHAVEVLGLIPGVVLLSTLGVMASYAGLVIGQFKLKHPYVHSMGDAGEVLIGRSGRWIFGNGAIAFIIFIMGSHLIAGGHTLNILTDNATCTMVWGVVIGFVSFVCTLPRTLKNTTYLSGISFLSVIAAIVIVMVDLGIRRPGMEVIDGKMPNKYTLWGNPNATFADKMEAVTTIMFAFAGHVAFFSFMSELKNPKDFSKALAFLQISDISLYITSAVVIYIFGGEHVASPALDSASPLVRKIAWGVALGTVIIAGVINGHIAVKCLYVKLFRNRDDDLIHQNTLRAWAYWVIICAICWIGAGLLASGIPVFENILSLTGAIFASWFTFGLPGLFWLNMNFKFERAGRLGIQVTRTTKWSWKKSILLCVNVFFILVCVFTMVAGLYATGVNLKLHANEQKKKPFSCNI